MRWEDGDVCPDETSAGAGRCVLCPSMAGTKSLFFRGFLNWKNDLQLIMQVCLIDWSTNTHHSIFSHCLVIDIVFPIFYGYHAN